MDFFGGDYKAGEKTAAVEHHEVILSMIKNYKIAKQVTFFPSNNWIKIDDKSFNGITREMFIEFTKDITFKKGLEPKIINF